MHPFEDLTVRDGTVGIHWFGQSSFAIKDATGTIIQVDPYFPRERPAERYVHARPPLHEAALHTDCMPDSRSVVRGRPGTACTWAGVRAAGSEI